MRKSKALPQPEKGSLPAFVPVPRRPRHDGWTPERQKAFIEALADTGCVDRAARMVNIAQTNCYALRRAPGAEGFRRAWDAALDMGLQRLKDIAFERAIEGELVPVIVGGKLIGYRRKRNDALLMFCLRHYGQDGEGRRTTINYFSTRAEAGAAASAAPGGPEGAAGTGGGAVAAAAAAATTTTVRTVISGGTSAGPPGGGSADEAAALIERFQGVALDEEARTAVEAALLACAERHRAVDRLYTRGGTDARLAALDDPGEPFVPAGTVSFDRDEVLAPVVAFETFTPFVEGEPPWTTAEPEEPEGSGTG